MEIPVTEAAHSTSESGPFLKTSKMRMALAVTSFSPSTMSWSMTPSLQFWNHFWLEEARLRVWKAQASSQPTKLLMSQSDQFPNQSTVYNSVIPTQLIAHGLTETLSYLAPATMAHGQTDPPIPGNSPALYLTHFPRLPSWNPEALGQKNRRLTPPLFPYKPHAFSSKNPILASPSTAHISPDSAHLWAQHQIKALGSDHLAPPALISHAFLTGRTHKICAFASLLGICAVEMGSYVHQ